VQKRAAKRLVVLKQERKGWIRDERWENGRRGVSGTKTQTDSFKPWTEKVKRQG